MPARRMRRTKGEQRRRKKNWVTGKGLHYWSRLRRTRPGGWEKRPKRLTLKWLVGSIKIFLKSRMKRRRWRRRQAPTSERSHDERKRTDRPREVSSRGSCSRGTGCSSASKCSVDPGNSRVWSKSKKSPCWMVFPSRHVWMISTYIPIVYHVLPMLCDKNIYIYINIPNVDTFTLVTPSSGSNVYVFQLHQVVSTKLAKLVCSKTN